MAKTSNRYSLNPHRHVESSFKTHQIAVNRNANLASSLVVGNEGFPVILGRYRLQSHFDQGQIAVAFEAKGLDLDRTLAIKVPGRELIELFVGFTRRATEAKKLSQLRYPGMIALCDIGNLRVGQQFLVAQYIEGQSPAISIDITGTLPLPVCEAV